TASLELGIDIGSVDLVCQLGSTRSIGTLLQRVGRAEHKRGGLPKGRLFPLSRDELVECVAALRSVSKGDLDCLQMPDKPLDILAQQIVACAACEDWAEQNLFDLIRSAYPYRKLTRQEFDDVLKMLAEGFSTRRGRRGALVHHDAVNHRVRGRKGARLRELSQAVSELREDIEKRIKGSLQERKAEPAPNPSQEGNGRGADECLLPAREESGGVVPKFGSTASIPLLGGVRGGSMESRHGL